MSDKYTYATLVETNGENFESWYYFIRYQGNEKALALLEEQLRSVNEMVIIGDLSTFDLELRTLVSETTAKEMTKIEVNSIMFHRKFDGRLKDIKFGFTSKHKDDDKIEIINRRLGLGRIDKYIDKEDIDLEDLDDFRGASSGSDSSYYSRRSGESSSESPDNYDTEEIEPSPIQSPSPKNEKKTGSEKRKGKEKENKGKEREKERERDVPKRKRD